MKRLNFETLIENRLSSRLKREDKAIAKLDQREQQAEQMIGELNGGKFYVFPVGGRYKESTNKAALVQHLIRNGYV